eukprot:TRINITY_DN2087_c0_g1_i1.p1 TRINITY_DN2087_c0_g1~~TRINITY_DN2087_c0_g1_i1.p1  ORF type:complete len:237 (+),score=3.93 TRINITY_DN2087_c0_g1_i1:93-713(+)
MIKGCIICSNYVSPELMVPLCAKCYEARKDSYYFRGSVPEPTQIIPLLYLSSQKFANDVKSVKALGIKHILSLSQQEDGLNCFSEFNHKVVKVSDDPLESIELLLEEIFEFINEGILKNESVLVHCYAGVSRSPAVIIAYLIKSQRWTLGKAYQYVWERRKIVCPNDGFLVQLKKFELHHLYGFQGSFIKEISKHNTSFPIQTSFV